MGVTHRMSFNINDPPTDSLGLLDPSESNTGSTDLFSDDTDDKVEKAQAALSSHEVAKRRPAEDRREEVGGPSAMPLLLSTWTCVHWALCTFVLENFF